MFWSLASARRGDDYSHGLKMIGLPDGKVNGVKILALSLRVQVETIRQLPEPKGTIEGMWPLIN